MTARPTGVNLKIECSALKGKFQKLQYVQLLFANTLFILYPIFSFYTFFSEFVTKLCNHEAFKFDDARNSIISQCEDLLERDLRDNKAMGKFGAEAILKGITQNAVLPNIYSYSKIIGPILEHFSQNQHFLALNRQFVAILLYHLLSIILAQLATLTDRLRRNKINLAAANFLPES